MFYCEFSIPPSADDACAQALQPHIDSEAVIVHEHRVMPIAPEGAPQSDNLWRLTATSSAAMRAVLDMLDGREGAPPQDA